MPVVNQGRQPMASKTIIGRISAEINWKIYQGREKMML